MQKKVLKHNLVIGLLSILLVLTIGITFTYARLTGNAEVNTTISFSNGGYIVLNNEVETLGSTSAVNTQTGDEDAVLELTFTEGMFKINADEKGATLKSSTDGTGYVDLSKVTIQFVNQSTSAVIKAKITATWNNADITLQTASTASTDTGVAGTQTLTTTESILVTKEIAVSGNATYNLDQLLGKFTLSSSSVLSGIEGKLSIKASFIY